MRYAVAILLAALTTAVPALGADWSQYGNARFGYSIAVPPGYTLASQSDNGDGAVFTSADHSQTLTVWGGLMTEKDFASDMASRMATDKRDGWNITYRAEAAHWVTYSGTRGSRILYARSVATCAGTGTASFRLEYDHADVGAMNDEVMRLARSLKDGNRC